MSGDQDKHQKKLKDLEVPLLQDVIKEEDSVQVGKNPKKASTTDEENVGLNESTIMALLGDEWKETSDKAFKQVQSAVEQNQSLWSGKDTAALNKALKVKIDKTLHNWLQETVNNNIDSLRNTLLDALTEEIEQRTSKIDTNNTSNNER